MAAIMGSIMKIFHGSDSLENVAASIYDLEATDIEGNKISFDSLRGKVILIVNVASACGRTVNNYKQLQPLYEEFKERGLVILGFPCNQFLYQESGDNKQIKDNVCSRFKVTFPLMETTNVNGPQAHPVYRYLKSKTDPTPITWNFEKFLIDRKGDCVRLYGADPNSFRDQIVRMLDEAPPASDKDEKEEQH